MDIKNAAGIGLSCIFNPAGCPQAIAEMNRGPVTNQLVEKYSKGNLLGKANGAPHGIKSLTERFTDVAPGVGHALNVLDFAEMSDNYLSTMKALAEEGVPGVIIGRYDEAGNPDPRGAYNICVNAIDAGLGNTDSPEVVVEAASGNNADLWVGAHPAEAINKIKQQALAQVESYRENNPLPPKRYPEDVMYGDDPPEDIPDHDYYDDPYDYLMDQIADSAPEEPAPKTALQAIPAAFGQ